VALGIHEARYPWLLLTDADGQFNHDELPRLWSATAHADAVVGYRQSRRDSSARRVASALYSTVVRRVAGARGVRDIDCAFKLIRRDLVGRAPLRSRTGVVNAEILGRVLDAGGRIEELPVQHLERTAGRARFEASMGPFGALPAPREAASMLREVATLAIARHVRGLRFRR